MQKSDLCRRGRFLSFIVASLVLTLSVSVHAGDDGRPTQRDLYQQGKAQFEEQRYLSAADAFKAAHQRNPLPALLQNIGACYERLAADETLSRAERLSHAAQAIAYFEQYIGAAGAEGSAPTRDRLAALQRHMRTLQAEPRDGESHRHVPPDAHPLHRRPWFIALLVSLSVAAVGGATAALIMTQKPPSPPSDAIVLDATKSSLELHF